MPFSCHFPSGVKLRSWYITASYFFFEIRSQLRLTWQSSCLNVPGAGIAGIAVPLAVNISYHSADDSGVWSVELGKKRQVWWEHPVISAQPTEAGTKSLRQAGPVTHSGSLRFISGIGWPLVWCAAGRDRQLSRAVPAVRAASSFSGSHNCCWLGP